MIRTNTFFRMLLFIFLGTVFFCTTVFSQTTANDGNWSNHHELLLNTPEADMMVRTGDIDNLGFGWPADFDPFSGNNTPIHSYPWAVDSTDPAGTDRIMVITSYIGSPPAGQDGYTGTTSRPENNVQPITLTFPSNSVQTIRSAMLQIFADDFQAPLWKASYEIRLDDIRVPSLEAIFNNLLQTGPIGKIVSLKIPSNLLYLLNDDTLRIVFDDSTSGAGDGYAIDFIKLLINPVQITQTGTIQGVIIDKATRNPLENVRVVANGISEGYSDAAGQYQIDSVLAGLVNIQTFKPGYGSESQTVELSAGETITRNFELNAPAPEVVHVSPADSAEYVNTQAPIVINFNAEMDTSTLNSSTFIFSDTHETLAGTFTKTLTSLTFTPAVPLRPDMLHRVSLTSGAKSISGISLVDNYTWVFSTGKITSLDGGREKINHSVQGYDLLPNYPNPFGAGRTLFRGDSKTTIKYRLPVVSRIDISIYNIFGQKVATLVSAKQAAGTYQVEWNASGFASGIYFYKMETAKGHIQTRKLILLK